MIRRALGTHLVNSCLLKLPDVGDPADAVTHKEDPGDGEADLGVPHVPHLAWLLTYARPRDREAIESLNLERQLENIQTVVLSPVAVTENLLHSAC